MKRILSILLCIGLLSLCGCGGKTEEAVGDAGSPIAAAFAETETAVDHAYFPADTEDACYVIFTARDSLTAPRLHALEVTNGGYIIGEQLCGWEAMEIGQTLLAPLTFYGDMTAYGLVFTDSNGSYRSFAVYISGEDGSLILQEFVP